MITPTLLGNLKWKGYLIFMATNLAFIPLVYFCYPETANLTLEEVDHLFTKGGKHGLKEVAQLQPTQPVVESRKAHDDDEKAIGIDTPSHEHVETLEKVKDDKSL